MRDAEGLDVELQRHWSSMRTEVVDCVLVSTDPLSNIASISKRHTQANNTHAVLNLHCDGMHTRYNHLVHISTIASKHVELIRNEQLHRLHVLASSPLSGEDVPLRRSSKNQVRLLKELQIGRSLASKLNNRLATGESTKSLLPIDQSLVHQLLEGGNVNSAAAVFLVPMTKQRKFGTDGLSTTRWRTKENIVVRIKERLERLGLDFVKVLPPGVQLLVIVALQCLHGGSLHVQKGCMRRESFREGEFLEGHCDLGFCVHPAIRNQSDEVVRWHRLGNGDRKFDEVFVHFGLRIVLSKKELVMEQDILTIAVLNQDPVVLCESMDSFIPHEVWCNGQLNTQHRTSYGLNLGLNLQARELGHKVAGNASRLRHAQQLTHARRIKVKVAGPGHVDPFGLLQDISRAVRELTKRRHRWPHALFSHLAQVECCLGHRGPALLQGNFKDCPENTAGRLCDVNHVSHQSQSFQLKSGNESLQKNIDLRMGFVNALLDWNGNAAQQLGQFKFLVLADWDVLEFVTERKDTEKFNIGDGRLDVLRVRQHGVVTNIVVRRNPSKLCGLQAPSLLVVFNQSSPLQNNGGRVNKVNTLLHQRIIVLVIGADTVQTGGAKHSNKQISIPEPFNTLFAVPDIPENNLSIHIIGQPTHQLTFDGQLLVHQRKVVLNLRLRSDDDTLTKGIKLRPSGSSQHLQDILRAQLNPTSLLGGVNLGSFNDDCMGGKVNTPGKSCSTHKNLDTAIVKERLNRVTVCKTQSSMVDTKPIRQKVFKGRVINRVRFLGQNGPAGGITAKNLADGLHLEGLVSDILSRFGCLLTRVNENQHLVPALPDLLNDFVVANVIHCLQLLDGFLISNTNELLLQWAGSV